MKTILLIASALLLAGCGDKNAEESAAKAREEARDARREAARQKARADAAERAAQLVGSPASDRILPREPVQPAAPVSQSSLTMKTDHWFQLSAATAKVTPFIRRAIAAGVNDPYFQREAPKVAAEINALAVKGEALKLAWEQSGEAGTAQQIRGLTEMLNLLKQAEDQARAAPGLSNEEVTKAKVESLATHGIENVPSEVMKAIIERAKRTSDDFMLEATIKNEGRDYLKVEAFRNSDEMPKEERDRLLARVQRKNPESWSMMWNDLTRQTEGYRTITKWAAEGVPGIEKEKSLKIIEEAKSKYPGDWTMMVYEVNQMADTKE